MTGLGCPRGEQTCGQKEKLQRRSCPCSFWDLMVTLICQAWPGLRLSSQAISPAEKGTLQKSHVTSACHECGLMLPQFPRDLKTWKFSDDLLTNSAFDPNPPWQPPQRTGTDRQMECHGSQLVQECEEIASQSQTQKFLYKYTRYILEDYTSSLFYIFHDSCHHSLILFVCLLFFLFRPLHHTIPGSSKHTRLTRV